MKNKKGFTLIELLAVVALLGLIMVIATSAVNKSIQESRNKAKYIAAKEITEIAIAYLSTEGGTDVSVQTLIDNYYLEKNVTNPKTGKNDENFTGHYVTESSDPEQNDYNPSGSCYKFVGYKYCY